MADRPRIVFSYSNFREMQPFTRQDFEILSAAYRVFPLFWSGSARGLVDRLRLDFSLVRADIAYFDFAYEHAYQGVRTARSFGKRSIVRIAGFDVVEEEWDTSGFPRGWKHKLSRILTNADKLIACSVALKEKAMRFTGRRDIEVIPYGVDLETFCPATGTRDPLVLTTSYLRRDYVRRKGLRTFLDAGRALPDFQFEIVGPDLDGTGDYLRSIAPPNVTIRGGVTTSTLVSRLRRAQVYCQLSEHEGFGLALAEAMAVGCAPVVTRRGALPEVVGDAGIYVEYGDSAGAAQAIARAAASHPDLGTKARRRVVENFSIEHRRQLLLDAFEDFA